jgi:hypothetical protein
MALMPEVAGSGIHKFKKIFFLQVIAWIMSLIAAR